MSKLFKRVSGITLGLALCFGFSFSCSNKQSNQMARAEEAVYAEAIFTSDNQPNNSSYTGTFTNTTNGFSWTVEHFNNNNNGWSGVIKCGRNKNNTSIASIATASAVSEVITKASVSITSVAAANVNSIKFYGGADGSTEIEDITISTGLKEVTIPAANRAENQIYKFVFDCKSGSSNGFVAVDSVKLYYDAGTPATSVSISSEYYQPIEKVVTIEKGDGGGSNCDELSALVLPENADDRSVTWSSNNDSIAQVDEFGYVVIDTSAVGQATITATANGGTNVSDYITYAIVDSSAAEYDITTTVTNGSYSGPSKIIEDTSETVTIAADEGYKLPSSVSVSGATLTSYNSVNGEIVVSNPTANVTINAVCPALENYTISVSATNCTYTGDATIQENGTATLTFTAEEGYELPSTVTELSGATETSWNDGTGVLVISNPTANVAITMTANAFANNSGLVAGRYYIKCGPNYFTGTLKEAGVGGSTTTKPTTDAAKFNFNLVGVDKWTICNDDGKYLVINDAAKGVSLTDTKTALYVYSGDAEGTFRIKAVTYNRYFSQYDAAPDFRTIALNNSGRTYDLTFESAKEASRFEVDIINADKNILKNSTFDGAAALLQGFEARLYYTDNTYDIVNDDASWVIDTTVTGTTSLTVTYLDYTPVIFDDIAIYAATMDHLVIDATNAKTTGYYEGDSLNYAGLVVTGIDTNNNEHPIDLGNVNFSPINLENAGEQEITVTYVNEDSSTATGTYTVNVSEFDGYPKVTSLNDLTIGDSYIIASPANNALMGATSSGYALSIAATDAFSPNKEKVSISLPENTAVVTLLYAGENSFYLYNLATERYYSFSSSNATTEEKDSIGNATVLDASFSNNGQISLKMHDGSRGVGFNAGASPKRFASYALNNTYNTIALYKFEGSAIKTDVTGFANSYLKMNDSNYDGDISTPNCEANYNEMKDAYAVLLDDAEKNVLQYSDDYADARARLNAWATANGETFTYGNETPFESLRRIGANGNILTAEDDNTFVVLLGVFSLGVSALSAFYLVKKRKRAQ